MLLIFFLLKEKKWVSVYFLSVKSVFREEKASEASWVTLLLSFTWQRVSQKYFQFDKKFIVFLSSFVRCWRRFRRRVALAGTGSANESSELGQASVCVEATNVQDVQRSKGEEDFNLGPVLPGYQDHFKESFSEQIKVQLSEK